MSLFIAVIFDSKMKPKQKHASIGLMISLVLLMTLSGYLTDGFSISPSSSLNTACLSLPTVAPTVSKQVMTRRQSQSSKYHHWTRLPLSPSVSSWTTTTLNNNGKATWKLKSQTSLFAKRRNQEEDDDEDDDAISIDDVDIIDTTVEGDESATEPTREVKNFGSASRGSSSGSSDRSGKQSGSGGGAGPERQLSQEEIDFMEKIRKYIEEKKAKDPNYDPLNDPELQKQVKPPPRSSSSSSSSSPFTTSKDSAEVTVEPGSDEEFTQKFDKQVALFAEELKELFSDMTEEQIEEMRKFEDSLSPDDLKYIKAGLKSKALTEGVFPDNSDVADDTMSEEEAMDILMKTLRGEHVE